jgi:pimeloyl-ACP methyl ester carboxylesterase
MAGFAARHPRQVAGMVFVETPKALTARLYPDVVPQIRCNAAGNVERRDYLAVEHAAWDHRKQLGDFPLTIITNDYGASVDPNTDEATNVKDQRGWFELTSQQGRQVIVTTGHNVARDQPDLVVREIAAVLEAARSR